MSDYEDSFNMIIGSVETSINLLDNPYINLKVYDIDQDFVPKPSENIKLAQCPDEYALKFIKKKTLKFYPNNLCF
jgi:hypothetical protein